MHKLLRIVGKIILLPVITVTNIFLYFTKGMLYVVGGIMGLLSIICVMAGVIGITNELYRYMVIPAFISAYLYLLTLNIDLSFAAFFFHFILDSQMYFPVSVLVLCAMTSYSNLIFCIWFIYKILIQNNRNTMHESKRRYVRNIKWERA